MRRLQVGSASIAEDGQPVGTVPAGACCTGSGHLDRRDSTVEQDERKGEIGDDQTEVHLTYHTMHHEQQRHFTYNYTPSLEQYRYMISINALPHMESTAVMAGLIRLAI